MELNEELELIYFDEEGLSDDEIPQIDGIEIVCGTGFKDDDLKVMHVLKDYKRGHFPSVSKLAELTGLPEYRVRITLSKLAQQNGLAKDRKARFEDK